MIRAAVIKRNMTSYKKNENPKHVMKPYSSNLQKNAVHAKSGKLCCTFCATQNQNQPRKKLKYLKTLIQAINIAVIGKKLLETEMVEKMT